MAVVTVPFTRISAEGSVVLEAFMDIEDTDWRATNDDGDPDDYRVLRFHGTYYGTGDITLEVKRGNGSNWVLRTIPAAADPQVGTFFEQNTGGPVKYETDVPSWRWGS